MSTHRPLRPGELDALFADPATARQFPPLLSTKQAAELLGVSEKTLGYWKSAGRLEGVVRKRGKRNFYLRNRLIAAVFEGPEW